jgi:hypothetical protein
MKHARSTLFAAAVALLVVPALMSLIVTAQSNMILRGAASGGGGGGACPEASSFLARASGLDAPHVNASSDTICDLVAHGVWSKLDGLWLMGTQNATTANLNLKSSSFTLIPNGSPNFVANDGYLGVDASTTVFLNTQFNPVTASGHYTLNSASMGVWSFTNALAEQIVMGAADSSTVNTALILAWSTSTVIAAINTSDATAFSFSISDPRGSTFVNRPNSSDIEVHKNGALLASLGSPSTSIPNLPIYVLARNSFGSAGNGSPYRIGMAFVGGGLTLTDLQNLNGDICNKFFTPLRGSCL